MSELTLAPADSLPHVRAADLPAMIDPAHTALVVVDVQVDFAAPEGLIGSFGVNLAPAHAAIDRIEPMIAAARKGGASVAFLRVVTRPESDPRALRLLMERRGEPGGEAICRAGSGGEDYWRLFPHEGDIEIEKLLFDAFAGTDFDAQLQARGIDTLVMTGLTTECCVDSTARGAFHLGYNVFLASDACAAYEPRFHAGPLEVLRQNIGLLTTSADVVAAWA